ncbi:unnamed protein product [Closterium sp. NIES-54]
MYLPVNALCCLCCELLSFAQPLPQEPLCAASLVPQCPLPVLRAATTPHLFGPITYCTALHCSALHCTALHCTALHRTAFSCHSTCPAIIPLKPSSNHRLFCHAQCSPSHAQPLLCPTSLMPTPSHFRTSPPPVFCLPHFLPAPCPSFRRPSPSPPPFSQFLLSTAPSHPDRCAVLSLDRRALQRQSKRGPKGPPLSWKGYACEAAPSQIQKYTDVEARALCPDDWFFVQELVFLKNCFSLPPRRCLARTPQQPTEPLPFPQSLFDQASLADGGVRWEQQQCGSFHCLNTRALGDCRNCFNLSLESHRWQHRFRGNPTMQDVLQLKNGSLRLGLDVGGGTGSFAAHMARHGVTVMTTAMNYETVSGRHAGLPYFEAIAMRGLIPLFLPHKARLPFYDNTLDVIHSVNSVKYMPVLEFEDLVFEWDRVLRPGGLMWFEMFYAPVDDMVLYVAVLQQLRYHRLHWTLMPKPDRGEIEAHQLYLNCVIEKPARRNALKPVEFV